MYDLNDTIVAVSSPASEKRAIVRIAGPATIDKVSQIFSPSIANIKSSVISGSVNVDDELKVDAKLYLFLAPHSYTGEHLAEIHIYTNPAVTEAVICNLLGNTDGPVRMAGPGEFTARRFLNGKIDLTQAEAVNEIVTSSNKFQLAAAEKLLSGRLAETTAKVRSEIMDCLSLIEAGLDFSGEDIEFITASEAVARLIEIKNQLEQLLSRRFPDEAVVDLPAVGIAGATNAGKSSLLNKLLGKVRSIVSDQRKTTRDVLTSLLTLRHCRCVLFDCAGLTLTPTNILDELAQQAAIEALNNAAVVVLCIDITKTDYSEDKAIRNLIEPKELIPVTTKSDFLSNDVLTERRARLSEIFGVDFLATSAKTGTGVEVLRNIIDKKLIEMSVGSANYTSHVSGVALTARHRQAAGEAIENITESVNELKAGSDEVAAMTLRAAFHALSTIEQHHIDEQILDRIFSRFCIGK